MEPQIQTVHVDLAGRGYDIHIGPGLIAQAGAHIGPLLPRPFTVIVTDETLRQTEAPPHFLLGTPRTNRVVNLSRPDYGGGHVISINVSSESLPDLICC